MTFTELRNLRNDLDILESAVLMFPPGRPPAHTEAEAARNRCIDSLPRLLDRISDLEALVQRLARETCWSIAFGTPTYNTRERLDRIRRCSGACLPCAAKRLLNLPRVPSEPSK